MHFKQTTDTHFGCIVPGASTRYPLSLYRTHLEQSSHALAGLPVQAVTNASGIKPYVGTRLCLPVPCSLTSYLANSVQTLQRLSQKDSWLSLCAAARIWEQFFYCSLEQDIFTGQYDLRLHASSLERGKSVH